MESYSIADAKARFSEVVERVAAGETVEITKRGKLMVKMIPAVAPRKQIDVGALERLTSGQKFQEHSAVELIREMRDAKY
jgi:prevent-host-death family protein